MAVLRRALLHAGSDQWLALTFARATVEQMRRSPHAIRLLVTSALPRAVLDKCGSTCP